METTMSQAQHEHAAFDVYPALVRDLTAEFGSDGIDAIIEKFIAAEQADFFWESRFAERDLGEFESFDGDEDGCRRVAMMGYFRAEYYVAICVVDAEKHVASLITSRHFESFVSAEIAFVATS